MEVEVEGKAEGVGAKKSDESYGQQAATATNTIAEDVK
jgi:hypothetical protein